MTYRAAVDIHISRGVRAYSAGDVVPDSAVKNLDIEDKVVSEDAPKEPARGSHSRGSAKDAPKE